MFKNMAMDALGLSDIGAVIKPEDYNKVDSDDYVMHEEGEKIYFLIKSKTDEYCFTNLALIHLDGSSAVSKKRLLNRYSYSQNIIRDVRLETAGTVDLDIEIKFVMGDKSYSIDVAKNFIAPLKDLYKALVKISSIQKENGVYYQYAQTSLNTASSTVGRATNVSTSEEQFKAINWYAFNWLKYAHETYVRKDFGEIFEKFINN
ncbi:PH domain-containing protein [Sphaerospermopsis torques-reginae]|uniref:PH domain-containing protein n=1 Tax=Sphaerospermopsis torques-reginae ITEP-024 TaxID=984208 RepID=A0ABX8WVM4_9CYAN|nr:PH domain-containing protein [Sphaerospermopsis torques-reginae]QYX30455.1 PH domain-containing protein [Sphaerospermopsis torques-reginae ITEP-024]